MMFCFCSPFPKFSQFFPALVALVSQTAILHWEGDKSERLEDWKLLHTSGKRKKFSKSNFFFFKYEFFGCKGGNTWGWLREGRHVSLDAEKRRLQERRHTCAWGGLVGAEDASGEDASFHACAHIGRWSWFDISIQNKVNVVSWNGIEHSDE